MSDITNTTLSPFDNAVEAVINGDEKRLQILLNTHPNLAKQHSNAEHQATLLHYVAANGIEADKQRTPDNIVTIARMLLDAGANPNQRSNIYGGGIGSTPLVGLVSSSHPAQAGKMDALVRLFCQYGNADGSANEQYPLITAISFRQREATKALIESGATVNHVVTASAAGQLALVTSLLQNTIPPYSDCFGQTLSDPNAIKEHALTVASMMGHLTVVQYLIEHGVNINAAASNSGDTALFEAVLGKHIDVVHYLLEHGADISSLSTETTGDIALDALLREYRV
ncbi:MAG: ankyrin repeat domain-containing protein [Phototrophicaceae bacterium]